MHRTSKDALLRRMGFTTLHDDPSRIQRHNLFFQLEEDFTKDAEEMSSSEWRRFAWSVWSARLASDYLTSNYDVRTEGQESATPRNRYEIPSPYGERERLLLPRIVANSIASMIGPLVEEETFDPRYTALYALEEGLGTHLLTRKDLESYPYPLEKLEERAKLTHFYNSYKMKPIKKIRASEKSVVKVYASSDGRTGSRVILFPDLDWDAAQDYGVLFLLSRDTFVVGEPLDKEFTATTFHLTVMVVASMLGCHYEEVVERVTVDPPDITDDFEELRALTDKLAWGSRQRDWFTQIPMSDFIAPYWLTPEQVVRADNELTDTEPLHVKRL